MSRTLSVLVVSLLVAATAYAAPAAPASTPATDNGPASVAPPSAAKKPGKPLPAAKTGQKGAVEGFQCNFAPAAAGEKAAEKAGAVPANPASQP